MHVPQTEVILRHHETELVHVTLPPGEYVIGRNAEVEIPVETPLLSRQHARLTINYDHLLLEDLGSSNGTFVADAAITEATRLFPNQSIRLGPDITLEVRRERAPSEPGVSLAPVQDAVRRALPEEVLTHKRYAIGQQVARGGMGAILAAQQQALQRPVAMKVMLDNVDAGDALRFVEEAQVTGQLAHPNIVPVYELGVDEQDQLFYTMKMVRGVTLKKIIELLAAGTEATVKKYPLPALLTIFQKACDALAFAHSRGVIHRDLKPENIMLGDFGEVLVMDWGLAKIVGGSSQSRAAEAGLGSPAYIVTARTSAGEFGSTMAGSVMGTPAYMSPEQARGEVEVLDARSDIYALGAILFELLHLRPVVTGPSPMGVVDKVAQGTVEWAGPKPKNRPVPDSLLAVCRQALTLEREQRYRTVEELQADLVAYQNGFATSAENAGLGKHLLLALKRHKIAAAGVAAVLLVGATLGTKAIIEGKRAEREAVRANAEAARANHTLAELKNTAPTLLALAETEAGLQRFDSALEKLNAALALDPSLLPSYWRRAWLLIGLERWKDAAAALRLAREKDPGLTIGKMTILPLLERFSGAASDAERWTPGAATELFTFLRRERAYAEIARLSSKLHLGRDDQLALVRRRLDEWLGKTFGTGHAGFDEEGRIGVTIDQAHGGAAIDTVDPLRGLPVEILRMNSTRITSLEPLRGLPLQGIEIGGTKITDLSPLAGMPLVWFDASNTGLEDLTPLLGMPLVTVDLAFTQVRSIEPLRGAPLRTLRMRHVYVTDLSPLRGMPLETLEINECAGVKDLTPLAGAPLKKLHAAAVPISDLSFLKDAPLEVLFVHGPITDLSPLRGKPLRLLDVSSDQLTDLSPLRGAPIEELLIERCNRIRDFTPLLEMPALRKLHVAKLDKVVEPLRQHPALKLISYGNSAFLPANEFWATYDAQQAAGKK